jgi:hypothetical protein
MQSLYHAEFGPLLAELILVLSSTRTKLPDVLLPERIQAREFLRVATEVVPLLYRSTGPRLQTIPPPPRPKTVLEV